MKSFSDTVFSQDEITLSCSDMIRLFAAYDEIFREPLHGGCRNIAIVYPNGMTFASLILCFLRAHNVTPMSVKHSPDEYAFLLEEMKVDALVTCPDDTETSHAVSACKGLNIPVLRTPPVEDIMQSDPWRDAERGTPAIDGLDISHFSGTITLFTSGTTAKSKIVRHTMKTLGAAIRDAQKAYLIEENDLCLEVLPMSHAHGLVTCLLAPFFTGSPIHFTGSAFDTVKFFDLIERVRPTWFAAVPAVFKSIINRWKALGKKKVDHSLRFIRSASARLDNETLASLRELFGVPIFQAYGMTECPSQVTTQQFNRNCHDGSVGYPVSIEVQIRDDGQNMVKSGETGSVYIKGENLFEGYSGKSREESGFSADGFFRTGDIGYLTGEGELFLEARESDIINKGGEKINPLEVEELLIRHPAIAEAACFPVSDMYYGENIAAAAVLKPDMKATEPAVKEYAGYFLSEQKIPCSIYFVDKIPRSSLGKLQRRKLESQLNIRDMEAKKACVMSKAGSGLTDEVLELYREHLKLADILPQGNFFALGGDSMRALKLVNSINDRFSVTMDIGEFLRNCTAEQTSSWILSRSGEKRVTAPPAPRREEQEITHSQKRILFVHEYSDNKAVYNLPVCYRLNPGADLSLLRGALEALVLNNESLRTSVSVSGDNRYVMKIHDISSFRVEEAAVESSDEFNDMMRRQALHVFDLFKDIPVKAIIFTISGTGERYLFINIHHIAFDGVSRSIFNRNLVRYYSALRDRNGVPGRNDFTYRDFAALQYERLEQQMETQKSFWAGKLSLIKTLNLPCDFPAERKDTEYSGDTVSTLIPLESSLRLGELARAWGVTKYTVMLSGFHLLMKKFSGQSDITTGVTISNRNYAGSEECIGLFVNILPLRSMIRESDTLNDLVKAAYGSLSDMQSNADIPFDRLLALYKNDASAAQDGSLFRHIFNYLDFRNAALDYQEIYQYDVPYVTINRSAFFDITFNVIERDGGTECYLNFATALFKKETVRFYAEEYKRIMEEIASSEGNETIGSLSSMRHLRDTALCPVENTGAGTVVHGAGKTLHQLFEEQVRKTPEKTAVVFEDQKLTYRELNERSNRLAHAIRRVYSKLCKEEVRGDTLIGLYLERSLDMITAMLGVLKSGAAYVPFDSADPIERLRFKINDCGCKMIVVSSETVEDLLFLTEMDCFPLSIDGYQDEISKEPAGDPAHLNKSSDLAYVIYTSGSTGTPKGVMIEHRSAVNTIMNLAGIYDRDNIHRVTEFTSYTFDVSVSEIFNALLYGKELHLLSKSVRTSPEDLLRYLNEKKIHLAYLPPVLLTGLKRVASGPIDDLHTILYAGEPCDQATGKYWSRLKELYNYYGPTEATIFCIGKRVIDGDTELIGKPIDRISAYILDESLAPVPAGVPGELYIGGDGLARGYLNRPDLTSERFIRNPFASGEEIAEGRNTRIYRTGDICRCLPDGTIEYIGRNDNQVKIRGFRIELGEIEHTLSSYPEIGGSVVVCKEQDDRNRYLAAYYLSDSELPYEELRSYLSKLLPDYMIPGIFIHMKEFPLSTSGKIDRKALPEPVFKGDEESYAAPATEAQNRLAAIWREVLGVDRIGVRDDFFRLGGDSIILMQLVSRIRKDLGIQITVKEAMNARTIEAFAERCLISPPPGHGEEPPAMLSEPGILTGEFGLLPIQQWFFDQVKAGRYRRPERWNLSLLIRTRRLDRHLLGCAFAKLREYHDALRLAFRNDEEHGLRQYYCGVDTDYEALEPEESFRYLDLSAPDESRSYHDILTSWQSEFSLYGGKPLCAMGYIEGLADGSCRVFLTLHHLISDGVSLRIISRDLCRIYGRLQEAQHNGRLKEVMIQHSEELMGPKGTSYRQWGRIINGYRDANADERGFWNDFLKGSERNRKLLEALLPPVDRVSSVKFSLSTEQTKKLLTECPATYGAELSALLLSAFGLALWELTGVENNYVIAKGHGREELDERQNVADTLGWFTSMYPVRLSAVPGSVQDTLKNITSALNDIPRKGIGYGVLFGYGDRMPPICFDYVGQIDQEQSGTEWKIMFEEDPGTRISPENIDAFLIDVNIYGADGNLVADIAARLNNDALIEFSDSFRRILISL